MYKTFTLISSELWLWTVYLIRLRRGKNGGKRNNATKKNPKETHSSFSLLSLPRSTPPHLFSTHVIHAHKSNKSVFSHTLLFF